MIVKSPLVLPAYKLVSTPHTTFDEQFPNYLSKAALSSYTWTRRPVTSNPLTTPILYHKGSWLALHGNDPSSSSPYTSVPQNNNYGLDRPLGALGATLRFKQYGRAWGTQTRRHRVPRAILYTCAVDVIPDQVTSLRQQNASVMESMWANVETNCLEPNAAGLAAKNVFTGCLHSDQSCFPYITDPFPSYDLDQGEPYATNGGLCGPRRIVDATRFTGGDLLVLYGLRLNEIGTYANAYWSNDLVPKAWSPDSSPTRIANEISTLAACSARFNSYKMIVYLRRYNNTAGNTTFGLSLATLSLNIAADLLPYGVSFSGSTSYLWSDDISSTVSSDVAAWLTTLSD